VPYGLPMRLRRLFAAAAVGVVLVPVLTAPTAWAATPITPGTSLEIRLDATTAALCTADFVFTARGTTFLGTAAHCVSPGADTAGSGCVQDSIPLGTTVRVAGQDRGRLAYSSWITMQRRGERDRSLCADNDFALVALDPADAARVDPSVPDIGGPVGLATDVTPGTGVASYQPNDRADPVKVGRTLQDGPLLHLVRTDPPGVPGDSGSGYLDAQGRAFGVLATESSSSPPTNGVVDLAAALAYASRWGGLGPITLVPGQAPFHLGL
jgi:hypothetical protein